MVELIERVPTPAEYLALRASVSWKVPDPESSSRALAASRIAVCAMADSHVVGMGRVVGDGVFYWYMVDVIVDPTHQGLGVGKMIVRALEDVTRPSSLSGLMNLVAAPDVVPFYERLGYEGSGSSFMAKWLS